MHLSGEKTHRKYLEKKGTAIYIKKNTYRMIGWIFVLQHWNQIIWLPAESAGNM